MAAVCRGHPPINGVARETAVDEGRDMASLKEKLGIDKLRVAGDAIETVIDYRMYLPLEDPAKRMVGLVLPAGAWRDDIRHGLGMRRLERVDRGEEIRPLTELPLEALNRLSRAVGKLLGQFAPFMDDPDQIFHWRRPAQRPVAVPHERAPVTRRPRREGSLVGFGVEQVGSCSRSGEVLPLSRRPAAFGDQGAPYVRADQRVEDVTRSLRRLVGPEPGPA